MRTLAPNGLRNSLWDREACNLDYITSAFLKILWIFSVCSNESTISFNLSVFFNLYFLMYHLIWMYWTNEFFFNWGKRKKKKRFTTISSIKNMFKVIKRQNKMMYRILIKITNISTIATPINNIQQRNLELLSLSLNKYFATWTIKKYKHIVW